MEWKSNFDGYLKIEPKINERYIQTILNICEFDENEYDFDNNIYVTKKCQLNKNWRYKNGYIEGVENKYGTFLGLDILISKILKYYSDVNITGNICYSTDACCHYKHCIIKCIDNQLIYYDVECKGIAYNFFGEKYYKGNDLIELVTIEIVDKKMRRNTLFKEYILSKYSKEIDDLIENTNDEEEILMYIEGLKSDGLIENITQI